MRPTSLALMLQSEKPALSPWLARTLRAKGDEGFRVIAQVEVDTPVAEIFLFDCTLGWIEDIDATLGASPSTTRNGEVCCGHGKLSSAPRILMNSST